MMYQMEFEFGGKPEYAISEW